MSDSSDRPDSGLDSALNIGAALRATRQRLGRSLQDISDATRIKRSYLDAIEEMRLDELPSRPFTIGYVRAYANALGLDGEAAVARFKQDSPAGSEPLRAPVGVRKHADARLSLLAGAAAVVITAVLLWNLARHAMTDNGPAPVVAEATSAAPATQAAPATVAVSPAQPAPTDSTSPAPYATPGLNTPASSSAPAAGQLPGSSASVDNGSQIDPAPPPTFMAHGAVYGAPAQASIVTLQARKSVSLVVRDSGGVVRFAQMLKAGEAYRAPVAGDLSLDVSDAAAMRVYVNGQLHDDLEKSVTQLSDLTSSE